MRQARLYLVTSLALELYYTLWQQVPSTGMPTVEWITLTCSMCKGVVGLESEGGALGRLGQPDPPPPLLHHAPPRPPPPPGPAPAWAPTSIHLSQAILLTCFGRMNKSVEKWTDRQQQRLPSVGF